MKKPTLLVHFSSQHPDQPGLWLSRQREKIILSMEVTPKDIEQDKRETNWLNGQWGARIELVNEEPVQLDQKSVLDWLDDSIKAHAKVGLPDAVNALQKFRERFFGEKYKDASIAQMEASVAQTVKPDSPKVSDCRNAQQKDGLTITLENHTRDQLAQAKGFENAAEMNRLIASADTTTEDRQEAFLIWKRCDGTRAGLMKLPSR